MTILNTNISKSDLKTEVLSGITVALALVPEAVAFAIIANVAPLVGLYAAFIVCLITSAFGGRPGMISGATGALAVVMVSLVTSHGVEYLFSAVVLMGVIQILMGLLKLGKFIRLVPESVILGFVNGLAIVIFLAQLSQFKTLNSQNELVWMQGVDLGIMMGLVLVTMAIIYFLPKLTKAIPSSLAAILFTSTIVILLDIPTRAVGDMASIKGGFPSFSVPDVPFNWETLKIIFPYSLILASIGIIESLLTLTLIDEITETRGNGNKECLAQGAANIVTGFFGGMGGCAMIGQSIINVSSGARRRLSGLVAAVFLISFILFGSSLIENVPLAALVGVMFMVCIGTFKWTSLKYLRKMPLSDAITVVLVTSMTVAFDLAIAVVAGVIFSAIVFAWESATRIRARKSITPEGAKLYEMWGPLFFASTGVFMDKFTPNEDPSEVIIDFQESRIADHSGIEAVQKLTKKYALLGKKLHLRHLSPDCRRLLDNASAMIEVNIEEDPHYSVATDKI
ncbi:MAG: sodium-independent anion transporter [Halobacteriovoraceae bacterium]|nr:sodium-independent anion transporter [Halobacteriovoraceae bacterium]|tara:strand:+ start:3147 stop:4676 length:1530 start_codon:yes stop_codon:yes gene_type:complete